MASRKRARSNLSPPEPISPRNVKLKTDRAAQAATESNSDSSYVSAAAAVFSDSEGASDTDHTDVESATDGSISSEEPSSISSDSEDESDDESSDMRRDTTPVGESGERRINVRAGTKPSIRREETGGSLLQRLQNFLPEMKASNEELEREREEGTLGRRNIECADEDDGPHIEMVSTCSSKLPVIII